MAREVAAQGQQENAEEKKVEVFNFKPPVQKDDRRPRYLSQHYYRW